jgi:hypothetical protein
MKMCRVKMSAARFAAAASATSQRHINLKQQKQIFVLQKFVSE